MKYIAVFLFLTLIGCSTAQYYGAGTRFNGKVYNNIGYDRAYYNATYRGRGSSRH